MADDDFFDRMRTTRIGLDDRFAKQSANQTYFVANIAARSAQFRAGFPQATLGHP